MALHWRVITLRGEVASQTTCITTSTVATCLAHEVVQESGTTYGALWKRTNWSTPQAFFARRRPTEVTILLSSRFYRRTILKSNFALARLRGISLAVHWDCQTSHAVNSNRFFVLSEKVCNFDWIKIKVVHGCKLSNFAIILLFKIPYPYKLWTGN